VIYNKADKRNLTQERAVIPMLKKALWTLPILAIGMAIGGLALPNAFASSTPQTTMMPTQSQQMMQQALSSPQGQAMVQACTNYMGQLGQTQK
jgi:hypothetical protein